MATNSAFHPYIRSSSTDQSPSTGLHSILPGFEHNLRGMFPDLDIHTLLSLNQPISPNQNTIPSTLIMTPGAVSPDTPNPDIPDVQLTPTPPAATRRKRTTFSPDQALRLEQEYLSDSYMARDKRVLLANSLNLSENQVKTWFQNRRAKNKRDRKTDNSPPTSSRKTSPSRSISSPNSSTSSSSSMAIPAAISMSIAAPLTVSSPIVIENCIDSQTSPIIPCKNRSMSMLTSNLTSTEMNNRLISDYNAFIQSFGPSLASPLSSLLNPQNAPPSQIPGLPMSHIPEMSLFNHLP